MKTRSRMRASLTGRTCLLVFLCLSAGCWESHPTQEAGDPSAAQGSGATVSNDRPAPKSAESSSAEKAATLPASAPDNALVFKQTWQARGDASRAILGNRAGRRRATGRGIRSLCDLGTTGGHWQPSEAGPIAGRGQSIGWAGPIGGHGQDAAGGDLAPRHSRPARHRARGQ